jgi:hypothetical protein
VISEQGTAPDREKLPQQPDGGGLRLLLSIVRLLFWASVVVIRIAMRVVSWAFWSGLGFWVGYRLARDRGCQGSPARR